MSISLVLILAQLLTYVSVSRFQGQEDMPEYRALSERLKGRVRKVYSITTILADGGKETEDVSYDPQGYKVLLVRRPYKSQNEIQKEVYTYDGNHRLIRKEDTLGPDRYVSYQAKYDVRGRLAEDVKFEPEYDDLRRSVYLYNAEGMREKLCEYNFSEKNPFMCLTYIYDSKGRVEKIDHIGEENKVFLKEDYKYDASNRVSVRTDFSCSERGCHFAGDEIFSYDGDGQIVYWRKHSSDGSLVWEKTRKQLLGKAGWLETTIDSRPNSFVKIFGSFNSLGDLVLSTEVDKDGTLTRKEKYSYSYDNHNNWVLQKQFICSVNNASEKKEVCKESVSTSRRIVYYE